MKAFFSKLNTFINENKVITASIAGVLVVAIVAITAFFGLPDKDKKQAASSSKPAVVISGDKVYTENGVEIDKSAFVKGTALKITSVDSTDVKLLNIKNLAPNAKSMVGYNISAVDSNKNAVKPQKSTTLTFPVPQGFDSKTQVITLYSVTDDGSTKAIDSKIEGDKVVASVENVSTFVLVVTPKNSGNTSSGSNSSSSLPYNPTYSKVLPYDAYNSKWTPPFENGYSYNKKLDVNDNVFRDSLIYTGYNIKKHLSLSSKPNWTWDYIYSKDKRPLGILSNISYDYDGGSSGYETDEFGRPHIRFYEKNDMVCASFATYVYFNYLPNVAKIDTSNLTRPANPTLAQDWQVAALDWVKKGYSRTIDFKVNASQGSVMRSFTPAEPIPIGSIISFYDMKKSNKNWSNHVVIYAGYVNGQHWVYQVGNDCGPEFCTVERMTCNPYPMWPISIVTTPSTVLKYFE